MTLRSKFTKWYYRKGYRMSYIPDTVEMVFHCPLWVRPIVYFLFSPSTYYRESGYDLAEGFMSGFKGEVYV